MNQPEYMKAEEVAKLCRVEKRTVAEKWAFKPGFPKAIRPGKEKLWARTEILAWLETQRIAA